jgi:transposase
MRDDLLGRRVLRADETPVATLKPGLGKTHRASVWSYSTTFWDSINAVMFDFAESRTGRHASRCRRATFTAAPQPPSANRAC